MASNNWVYSVITVLDPPPPRHARYDGTESAPLCTSFPDWHLYRGQHDSAHCRIHIRCGCEGEATAGTLWSVGSIRASIWTLQHGVGCGLHRWAYLGWIHPGKSGLGYRDVDAGCAERRECASCRGVYGRAHITEALAYVDLR
jgi:hypothetical protein